MIFFLLKYSNLGKCLEKFVFSSNLDKLSTQVKK